MIVFIDRYDLATVAASRYARSLRPASLRAIHLTIDQAHAKRLADRWLSAGTGISLELVDCPDRRLGTLPLILSPRRRRTEPGT